MNNGNFFFSGKKPYNKAHARKQESLRKLNYSDLSKRPLFAKRNIKRDAKVRLGAIIRWHGARKWMNCLQVVPDQNRTAMAHFSHQ